MSREYQVNTDALNLLAAEIDKTAALVRLNFGDINAMLSSLCSQSLVGKSGSLVEMQSRGLADYANQVANALEACNTAVRAAESNALHHMGRGKDVAGSL